MSGTATTQYECKHAVYVEAQDGREEDILFVKEVQHLPDGTTRRATRVIRNYVRPFWVTREGYRKHMDKKEWEKADRVQEYKSTQIKLVKAVCRALGRAPTKTTLRMLARSPYLYGTDISTPALLKGYYQNKWPDAISPNVIAILDTETDMTKKETEAGYGEIVMSSLVIQTAEREFKIYHVQTEEYAARLRENPKEKILAAFDKYVQPKLDRFEAKIDAEGNEVLKAPFKVNLEIKFVKSAGEVSYEMLRMAHEWQPDILAIWNMNFDIPKMIAALEKYGYNLPAVWSDPKVPRDFQFFRYIQGPSQKVTASGKTMALHPAEQWHTVYTPASFYVLDAMCVYQKIRIAKGKESSYALDYILEKNLAETDPEIRKLKFDKADGFYGGEWHTFMQEKYPAEYSAYNMFDCLSMALLDQKTTDLKQVVSILAGPSEYRIFPSQPRRTCDDLHFVSLNKGLVIGSTSDQMEVEFDKQTVGITDWIVTLPSYLVSDDGLKMMKEVPNITSYAYAHVYDLDVESTYPTGTVMSNQSKETTSREIGKIKGVDQTTQRATGVNLTGGFVNAIEISCNVFSAPTLDTLLKSFKEQLPKSRAKPEMTQALIREVNAGHNQGFDIPNFEEPESKEIEYTDPATDIPFAAAVEEMNVTGTMSW